MTNIEQYETDPLTQMEVDASLISDNEESDQDVQELTDVDTDTDGMIYEESKDAVQNPTP